MIREDRGQLVLLAAAVLAVALVPLVLSYLQLGYHADVRASEGYDAPVENADRYLGRAVHEAASGVPANYGWSDRGNAVDTVRARLGPRLQTLAATRVETGTTYQSVFNQSAARAWASTHCPRGPNRQFGPCEARRGVVVQERAGRTHVLAVALDVTVASQRGQRRVTLVVRTVGG